MMMAKVVAQDQVRMTPTSLVWIVVKSKPGQEIKAKDHLEQQHFEVYRPLRLFENRKGLTMATSLFPNYMFARVTLQVERWKAVYGTHGVAGVLGRPECPIGVKDSVIQRIKDQEEDGYVKLAQAQTLRTTLQWGAKYRDMESGIEGILIEPLDDKRVRLLTQLLGDSRATVDIARLKLVEDCPAPDPS